MKVKCISCGAESWDIGEGTVFCAGCNAALGIVNRKVIEWDTKMVAFDEFVRQVFPEKRVPQEVAEEFGGEGLNHKIALRGMDLQARVSELKSAVDTANRMIGILDEKIRVLESENYRLREHREDDAIVLAHRERVMLTYRDSLIQISRSDDCGGDCAPLHAAARKALDAL